jgi:hypothetical protein
MAKNTHDLTKLSGFRAAVAEVFAGFAQLKQYAPDLRDTLGYLGITVETKVAADVLTVTVKDIDDDELVPYGHKVTDFVPEALARLEAERIQSLRYEVWHKIKELQQSSRQITTDEAVEALKSLGFSDAELPTVKTTADGYYHPAGIQQHFTVKLPGSVEMAAIVTAMEALSTLPQSIRDIHTAFPDAVAENPFQLVTSVNISHKLTWPTLTR